MIKKIIGWGLFALLLGVLAFGAVYRTQAKNGAAPGAETHAPEAAAQNAGSLNGAGQGRNAPGSQSAGGANDGTGQADAQIRAWDTLRGQVAAVDATALVVTLADGQTLEIAHRPWTYAQELGAVYTPGDEVEATGFYDEAGTFEAATLNNLTRSQVVTLRDENGRPGWAGGGQGGGSGRNTH